MDEVAGEEMANGFRRVLFFGAGGVDSGLGRRLALGEERLTAVSYYFSWLHLNSLPLPALSSLDLPALFPRGKKRLALSSSLHAVYIAYLIHDQGLRLLRITTS